MGDAARQRDLGGILGHGVRTGTRGLLLRNSGSSAGVAFARRSRPRSAARVSAAANDVGYAFIAFTESAAVLAVLRRRAVARRVSARFVTFISHGYSP